MDTLTVVITTEGDGMLIKPIETHYNGYRFRSRLEARYAVLFDRLGLEYDYEPEGFKLPSGCYLPDFFIKTWNVWAEIKPEPTIEAAELLGELKEATGLGYLLLCGTPWPGEHTIVTPGVYDCGADNWNEIARCRRCEGFCLTKFDFGGYENIGTHSCDPHHDKEPVSCLHGGCETIHEAYLAARHSRFEHGETPSPSKD